MDKQVIKYEKTATHIGLITLSRPTRANAINKKVLTGLREITRQIEGDSEVRCVVVSGEGKLFSSGFDLREQADSPPCGVREWEPALRADFEGIMACWNLPIPTIAAVRGAALAGGFELMLACDVSVAAENAVFGEPELKFGAGIVSMLLPWFVGPKIAKEIIYLGRDELSAVEAKQLGLVNRIVPESEVLDTALALAGQIAAKDPMVVKRTKRAINGSYEIMGLTQALKSSLDIDIQIEGEGSAIKREFLEAIRNQGLRAALEWRARVNET